MSPPARRPRQTPATPADPKSTLFALLDRRAAQTDDALDAEILAVHHGIMAVFAAKPLLANLWFTMWRTAHPDARLV